MSQAPLHQSIRPVLKIKLFYIHAYPNSAAFKSTASTNFMGVLNKNCYFVTEINTEKDEL